tara:strand:+ start:10019 stop:10402 length:384 start_codon:yes stop_codon:yes gene_type:complete
MKFEKTKQISGKSINEAAKTLADDPLAPKKKVHTWKDVENFLSDMPEDFKQRHIFCSVEGKDNLYSVTSILACTEVDDPTMESFLLNDSDKMPDPYKADNFEKMAKLLDSFFFCMHIEPVSNERKIN